MCISVTKIIFIFCREVYETTVTVSDSQSAHTPVGGNLSMMSNFYNSSTLFFKLFFLHICISHYKMKNKNVRYQRFTFSRECIIC